MSVLDNTPENATPHPNAATEPRCSCDGGPNGEHRDWCETRHPHHTCHSEVCSYHPDATSDYVIVNRAQLAGGILVGIGGEHDPVPTQHQLDRAVGLIFRNNPTVYSRSRIASTDEAARFLIIEALTEWISANGEISDDPDDVISAASAIWDALSINTSSHDLARRLPDQPGEDRMNADVIWVATLNENYQPPPRVSYAGIGPRGVPRVLSQFRDLIANRDLSGESTPSILLITDPDLDIGELSLVASEHGDRLGVAICRAVFPPSNQDLLGEVAR